MNTINQTEIIDRLIGYETGEMTAKEANAFITEAKKAGILLAVSKH